MNPLDRLLVRAAEDLVVASANIVRTAKGSASAYDEFDPVTSCTVGSVAIANGASVVVSVARSSVLGVVSATWNGLALTLDVDVDNASGVRTSILSKHNCTGATGDVVVSVADPDIDAGIAVVATQVEGLATASTLDKTATGTGNSTAPSSGATATTAQADEYLAGAIGARLTGTQGGTWDGSFSSGQEIADGVLVDVHEGYRIVSATGAYTAAKTGITSSQWAACIATYKAAAGGGTPTPTQAIGCLGAREVAFVLLGASGGTLSAATVEVSMDGALWVTGQAGESIDVFGTITGVAFNAGSRILVVAPRGRGSMPWAFARLKLTANTTITGLEVEAFVMNGAGS